MNIRVTQKDVAIAAGVSPSAVSLALSDDQRLLEATRNRIKALAQSMGYVPDANLSALCAYRNAKGRVVFHSELAYLTDAAVSDQHLTMQATYETARAYAQERGYSLVPFDIDNDEKKLSAIRKIWYHRNIKGVLIGPLSNPGRIWNERWDDIAVVAYGYSTDKPEFSRALYDQLYNMKRHLEALHHLGYRRVGLHLLDRVDVRTGGNLRAAYFLDRNDLLEDDKLPILAGRDMEKMLEWIKKYKLDAVISYEEEYEALRQRGIQIPESLGFSLLSWSRHSANADRFAGFDEKPERVAIAAVDMLIELVRRQSFGIPPFTKHVMLSGEFRSGSTVLDRTAKVGRFSE